LRIGDGVRGKLGKRLGKRWFPAISHGIYLQMSRLHSTTA
jgi:hypothetical protein